MPRLALLVLTALANGLGGDDDAPDLDASVTSREQLAQAGIRLLGNPNEAQQRKGISYFERALADWATPRPYSMDEAQGRMLAMWTGRWFHEKGEYEDARRFIDLAATSRLPGDCAALQKATLRNALAAHSSTKEASEAWLKDGRALTQSLLRRDSLELRGVQDPANDPYVYCLLSSFYLETLYEADWKEAAKDHYELAVKAWPQLKYTSIKKAPPGKILRVGVVSAFLHVSNSVMRDFGGTLARLPSEKFALYLIYLSEQGLPVSPACSKWAATVHVEEVYNEKALVDGVPTWLATTRNKIVAMELDLILYLDLTMSTMAHRLAMSRLAPVQVTSHGHPVTSGIQTIDYYVSWAAAEVESAADHYTEELVLLPSSDMHQYHDPVLKDGMSTVTHHKVPNGSREALFPSITGKRWYVCMQKPFKLHARFGDMLQKVLDADPEGVVILHAGADRDWDLGDRVVFLDPLPHHELLALYREADVVLDSYYAGGCTTTREAFEMGAVVVTLPAKYLGGRWTLAFYDILGIKEAIATDEDDYARLAALIGRDGDLRASIKARIAANIHKMWRSDAAVDHWTDVLLRLVQRGERSEL